METQQQTQTQKKQSSGGSQSDLEKAKQNLRALYKDAPDLGKTALERVLGAMGPEDIAGAPAESAGRVGSRRGVVSELTLFIPLIEGGGKRLRSLLNELNGNFRGADIVGTLHDMRFVFLDNDTKLLFATAYDGDWGVYLDDFATKIPEMMDMVFSNTEGWPGIRSGKVKDWTAQHQLPADSWYVANPSYTVQDVKRLQKTDAALNEFLDKISDLH